MPSRQERIDALCAKVDASTEACADDAGVRIKNAITDTRTARSKLERASRELDHELKLQRLEMQKWDDYICFFTELHTASFDISETWTNRPARYEDPDLLSQPLDTQCDELQYTIEEAERLRAGVDLSELEMMIALVDKDIKGKGQALLVDETARLTQVGEDVDAVPTSPMKHAAWITNTEDLLQDVADCLKRYRDQRASATDFRKLRAIAEEFYSEVLPCPGLNQHCSLVLPVLLNSDTRVIVEDILI